MTSTAHPAKRVTAADVARSLGISRATVGFVLNDTPGQTISAATRSRVLDEAKRLGYRPHTAARALASGHSRIILLVLPDWPLDYALRTHLDEASLALDEAGYALVTMTPHSGGQAQPLWETLSPDVVMGMTPFTPEQLESIRSSGVPHIIPAQPTDELSKGDQLGFAEGPRLQVEHLLSRGRARLVFARSADHRVSDLVAQRKDRADAALQDASVQAFVADDTVTEETAQDRVREWAAAGVDGVVAYNDDIAAMVVGAAIRSGIRVPDDLAVIGHDDTPLARLFVPALSSVRIDTAGLGRYLAELALSAATGATAPLAGPETDARLVVRETT